ncbi:YopX family protein [Lactiplantibacillus paraplantarum]|uniref:YopX family protein n=1 Tax=Lactiplantibacillus paraplantarum TaxID=60520 RepID=UPI003DA5F3D2
MATMIKFRAWDKATSSYRKVLEIEFYPDGELKKVKVAGLQRKGTITPDKLVLEQFTGLKDVNGKDIYVGDIVKTWSDVSELTMVPSINEIVSEDLFGTPGMFLKPLRAHFIEPCLHDYWSNQFEVIGNVHTDSELLEADK